MVCFIKEFASFIKEFAKITRCGVVFKRDAACA